MTAKAKSYMGIIMGEVGAILLLTLAFVLLIMRNRKGEHGMFVFLFFITLKAIDLNSHAIFG